MQNIDLNENYIINPAYKFRSDIKRIVLTNNNSLYVNNYDRINDEYTLSFSTIVHPLVAYLFSFFDGSKTLKDTIKSLSEALEVAEDKVLETFKMYVYNDEKIFYRMSDKHIAPIPKNFIIKKGNLEKRNLLENIDIEKMLDGDIDLTTMRYYIPNEMVLMVTNKCFTDCVYCYANTKPTVDKQLSFERIEELVKEAYSLGCRDFGLAGGDLFTYKNWDKLLELLHKHEYNPYISTKIPIGEKEIKRLKELNVEKVQISLDSINSTILSETLKVPLNYLEKMKHTFDLLKEYGIQLIVKSVVTRYNDTVENFQELIEFLLQYDNLYSLSIAPGETSLYKPFIYKSNKENIRAIDKFIKELNHSKVSMQSYMIPLDDLSFEEKMKRHKGRSTCSGNVVYFYILPDGKVTICEQIYWHHFFILGDLSKQSIMEVWNGEKALSIWNIKQSDIKKESPCSTCSDFDKCRRGQGSCWRMAIQAYGYDNYDFPYPQCPFAPPATEDFYIDKTANVEFIKSSQQ